LLATSLSARAGRRGPGDATAGQEFFFLLEEPALPAGRAGVAAQPAAAGQDAMTGDEQRNGIRAAGVADGAARAA